MESAREQGLELEDHTKISQWSIVLIANLSAVTHVENIICQQK